MNTKSLIITLITVILAPVVGCILAGIERKLSAKLQHRVGPPIIQPFYDFVKLFNKETVVVNKYQNFYIVTYLIFIMASTVMFILGMDLLMILFVFTIANIALIMGAASTGSPYSRLGSKREVINMIVYEPILILFIGGIYIVSGSFRITGIEGLSMPLIAYMPLVFISMLIVMLIKFKKSPFDFSGSHEAHQELVRGIITEFSGPGLALMELAHWYEYIFLLGLMYLFLSTNIFAGIALAVFTYLFTILIDNISARVKWQWMLNRIWPVLNLLCIANVLCIFAINSL
ncbi:MAG: NADH-quinone oxidoreductase subunit H [Bacillota bacterium]|nr:NADH-quinone oxidoreductase subunit H [Bacillota bacterium]